MATLHTEIGLLHERLKPLLRLVKKPANRAFITPAHGVKQYRGERKFWVGYSWMRPYAHHMTGLVYDAPLAYGDSWNDALQKLSQKVRRRPSV